MNHLDTILKEFEAKLNQYDYEGGFILYVEGFDNRDYNTDLIKNYLTQVATEQYDKGLEKGALKGERNRIILQLREEVRKEALKEAIDGIIGLIPEEIGPLDPGLHSADANSGFNICRHQILQALEDIK